MRYRASDSARLPACIAIAALALLAGCESAADPAPAATATVAVALVTPSPVPSLTATSTPRPTPNLDPETAIIHTVQAGETLFGIAQRYGVAVEALMAVNGIGDAAAVAAGQKLIVILSGDRVLTVSVGTPVPSATLEPSATPPPPPDVNGISVEAFVVLPDDVKQHIREIYARGLALGNNPRAFSKVGDSTIENPHFLARFDEPGNYNLDRYAYLQPVIDVYRGSFSRQGVSVRRGLHAWSMFDPLWADKSQCVANEGPVPCEIRLHKPSLILIRLGSNDLGVPKGFEVNLRRNITYSIESGVIPILGTKADRREGADNTNNNIIRSLAAEYKVPLWDFDLVAATLPNRGIDPTDPDGVHMSFFYAHNYALPEALQRGHAVHNLTALILLDKVWRALTEP